MQRVIITGATGAVGIALIREMISQKVEVLVLIHQSSRRIANIPKDSLVSMQYCGLDELARLQNDTGKIYDVFYHFAWEGTTGEARNDMYLQNRNVRYALDAVGAAKRFGCTLFIGAGSQAEYGHAEGILTAETPVYPTIGYGIGKLAAGIMTRQYAHQSGIKHIWVRILSVYGPYDWNGSITMTTISKFHAGEIPQFTRGEQLWDFLYSGDAARAFRLLGTSGIDGKTYVLGNGAARPLATYIRDLRDAVAPGLPLRLGALPYPPGQMMHLEADISQLIEDTGWMPETSYIDGIRKILEGMK